MRAVGAAATHRHSCGSWREPPDRPLYATATFDGDGFDCTVQDAAGEVVLAVDGYRTVAIPATVPEDIRRALSSPGSRNRTGHDLHRCP